MLRYSTGTYSTGTDSTGTDSTERRAVARSRASLVVACIALAHVLVLPLGCRLDQPPTQQGILTEALPADTLIPPRWGVGDAASEVGGGWLASFDDPGLDSIVNEALDHNPDLREIAAAVEAFRYGVKLANSRLLPQVGVNLSYGATYDSGTADWFNSAKGLGGIAWEPDVWGRLRAKRSAAEADFEAAKLDYAFARQSLAATTAMLWYQTTETMKLEALARQSVKNFTELFDLVKLRRQAGKVGDLDVAAASANVNDAEVALIQATAAAAESSRNLEVLVGRYPAAELRAGMQYTALPPPIRAGLPSALLARRPDVAAAEKQVVRAFRLEESAKLALLPSFQLNLNGGKLSDDLLNVLQLNPWIFAAGIGMVVPIYTGGALRAQIKIENARQQMAVAAYGGAALAAFREVENALMNEELLAKQSLFFENVLRDRTEAVRIAKLQYQAGSMNLLWVLELENQQIAAERDLIELQFARLANRIELHLALGGDFESAPMQGKAEPPGAAEDSTSPATMEGS